MLLALNGLQNATSPYVKYPNCRFPRSLNPVSDRREWSIVGLRDWGEQLVIVLVIDLFVLLVSCHQPPPPPPPPTFRRWPSNLQYCIVGLPRGYQLKPQFKRNECISLLSAYWAQYTCVSPRKCTLVVCIHLSQYVRHMRGFRRRRLTGLPAFRDSLSVSSSRVKLRYCMN